VNAADAANRRADGDLAVMDDASSPTLISFSGDLTHETIGAFYEVYNTLHFGLLESTYAGALHVELLALGIPVEREPLLRVYYKGHVVGAYRADLIVDRRLVLELKSMAKVGHPEKRQLLHYLRATNIRVGLVLNFGPASADFLRVVNG
jgi:GxxExxY protein